MKEDKNFEALQKKRKKIDQSIKEKNQKLKPKQNQSLRLNQQRNQSLRVKRRPIPSPNQSQKGIRRKRQRSKLVIKFLKSAALLLRNHYPRQREENAEIGTVLKVQNSIVSQIRE